MSCSITAAASGSKSASFHAKEAGFEPVVFSIVDLISQSDPQLPANNEPAVNRRAFSGWVAIPEVVNRRRLLQDELRGLMGKINVPNSVLSPVLCGLWNNDKAGGADKKSDDEIFTRLNILGGLAAQNPEQFTAQFGQETSAGLYDRFVYGFAPKLKYTVPEIVPEARCPVPVTVPKYCYEMKDVWTDEVEEGRERLGEIALRIAVVTSGINHEGTVSRDCMRAALNFMEWQEAIRTHFKPSSAEQDKESRCTEAILNAFMTCKDKDGNYAWKHWRVMYKNRNWHNYGGPTVSRVKKALCEHGVLVEETVPDELNEGKRRKTGRVCYAD